MKERREIGGEEQNQPLLTAPPLPTLFFCNLLGLSLSFSFAAPLPIPPPPAARSAFASTAPSG